MIAQFSLHLLAGLSTCWSVMPRSAVTTGFFRIQMLVALGLATLAAATMPDIAEVVAGPEANTDALRIGCMIIGVAAFLGSVVWTVGRRRAGAFFCYTIALLSWTVTLAAIPTPLADSRADWLVMLGSVTSAWLLGTSVVAMLLGHWYLTATGMSLNPLAQLNRLFASAVAGRAVAAIVSFAMYHHDFTTVLTASSLHIIWFALRWLAGIVAPAVAVVLVYRILKYRNTQSATGVLYAAVILVFIGEMTAMLLQREIGVPV